MEKYPCRIHILGAHKAGTTKLYELLSSQKKVFGSKPKQHLFFYNNSSIPENISFKNYLNFIGFKDKNYDYVVDATPDHLFTDGCIDRISELGEDCIILITLRNPIDRAFSHWRMTNSHKKKSDFIYHITNKTNDGMSFISRSNYHDQIKSCFDRFDRNKIHIFIFEDWIKEPGILIKNLEKITNLSLINLWDNASENASYNNRSIRIMLKLARLMSVNKLFSNQLRKITRNKLTKIGKKQNLSSSERKTISAFFNDDVQKLKVLIGNNLKAWKDFSTQKG